MPELPEVETIRLGLQRYIVGKTIEDVEVRLPKMLTGDPKDIIGAKVVDVRRFGKGLVIDLDNNYSIAIHIKLTGQLLYKGPDIPTNVHLSPKTGGVLPNKWTHVIFKLKAQSPIQSGTKVLLFLGAAHTRIYRELKRTGTEVNATFSYKPFVYPFSTEAERRYAFGKEIGDELVAKSFMEAKVVIPGMQKITKDFRKISLYARRALSGFTLDEIESVFYDMKRNRSYDIFMNLLSQKGVVVPLTEKMLDDFLKKEKLI